MFAIVQRLLVWILAVGGVMVFAWYVIASGIASQGNPPEPPTVAPAQLATFGVAAGALLATNLGAVLGIATKPGVRASFEAFMANQKSPWAQLVAAVTYIGLLLLAVYFYWRSGWSGNAAEVLVSSLSTLFGVLLGAMAAVFGAKE